MALRPKVLLGVLLAVAGLVCAESPTTPTTRPQRHLAVIIKCVDFPFWSALKGGVDDAAQELGARVDWLGPAVHEDSLEQKRLVYQAIARKVDGIAISPSDVRMLADPIQAAHDAGIAVVVIDSNLRSSKVASYIATDNFEAGRMAGEKMRELLKDRGGVAVLGNWAGSENATRREKGFEAALKPAPLMLIHTGQATPGQTMEVMAAASAKLLTPFMRSDGTLGLDGIFCPNESSTLGMLSYLESSGLVGRIPFIGFDASERQILAMQKGHIQALIVQNPWKIGYTGIKTLLDVLENKAVDVRIYTPAFVLTRDNLEDPVIQDLLRKHRPRR